MYRLHEKDVADLMHQMDGYLSDALFQTEMERELYASIRAIEGLVGNIRNLSAPFYSKGRGLGGCVRCLLNIPIKVFGRKQGVYNSELLILLEEVIFVLESVSMHLAHQKKEIDRLKELITRENLDNSS